MTKNRSETEKAILAAVTDIVGERGFSSLGVNAVAEAAGVSKVLIYRYFGSYRGLLEEWALSRNFWITGTLQAEKDLAAAAGDRSAIAALLKGLVRAQAEELRADKVSREILRWFLAEKDTAAAGVMARLEERGTAVAAAIAAQLGGEADMGALSAIVISGVYYLALLADRAEVFNGVDIATDAGWTRILASLDLLIDTLIPA
jgi:AcrR family transcriptional regulator